MNYLRQAIASLTVFGTASVRELRSLARPGARMVDEFECVISVLLAIVFAHSLGAQNVGWAAFSGYMVMRSHVSESLTRGILRIIGTSAGAGTALVLAPLVIGKPFLLSLSLVSVGGITLYFALVGKRSYAWLFTGLTFCMVLIDGMKHPSESVLPFAQSRLIEILAGTLACILVSAISTFTIRRRLPRQSKETPAQTAIRHSMIWHRGAAKHALQAAIALGLIPWIWVWTGITSLSQSSITIMAVMMIPVTSLAASVLNPITSRLVLRFVGCSVGGLIATLILLSSHHSPVLMTLGVCIGVLVGRHIENSNSSISYIGTQFVLAFLVVLVPDTYTDAALEPGIERLAGILFGVVILEPVLLASHYLFRDNPSRNGDNDMKQPSSNE
ncbi:FUSC family protein [Phyllobacterium myrsinacearum]|uniref:Putative membrane protein YccC n=1 Tax=Phyllobacterium myrsinacearum TaxID=28101 RepID=A0A839EHK1_9HYPH|nr:FUSC family protein [Phyllobacterium myrsinacearum]MBA8879461.1 putative membrane protein YccC [Phyllobacterium myrsinacearum]